MSDLMVKLSRDHDRGGSDFGSAHLTNILQKYHATMTPVADQIDQDGRYFVVGGVGKEALQNMRSDLSDLQEVEAAYIKPADDLP